MARQYNNARPKDLRYTVGKLLDYMGRHKLLLLLVAVLVTISALGQPAGHLYDPPRGQRSGRRRSWTRLVRGVVITACIYAVGALSSLGYTQTMVKAAQKVLYDIRRDLFAHLQTLPLRFFDTRRHGDIMSYFTGDVDTISDALNNSFTMLIQSFIQMTGTLLILFILNWRLSLFVVLGYRGHVPLHPLQRPAQQGAITAISRQYLGELNGYIEEMVSRAEGRQGLQPRGGEPEEVPRAQRSPAQGRRRRAELRRHHGARRGHHLLHQLRHRRRLWRHLLALQGLADVGSLASYLVFVRQACHAHQPVHRTSPTSCWRRWPARSASFKAMSQPPEVDEGTVRLDAARKDGKGWDWLQGRTARARPCAAMCALKMSISAMSRARPSSTTSPSTPSPARRSPLSAPPARARPPSPTSSTASTMCRSGRVVYDGIDVRDIRKDDLRRSLGIVLQDTHLFTGTIADNIRFGKLDATQEEVERAARIANADSFIRRLPKGYDTMVTSDGASLSQGQRQLLAIARAAVEDPPVLILDEATSSIDTRTEALIEKGMDRPHGGPHRLRHRPPPLHRAQCRRHHGARSWPHRRARRPRGSAPSKRACTINSTTACSNSADTVCAAWGRRAPPHAASCSGKRQASRLRRATLKTFSTYGIAYGKFLKLHGLGVDFLMVRVAKIRM